MQVVVDGGAAWVAKARKEGQRNAKAPSKAKMNPKHPHVSVCQEVRELLICYVTAGQ